MNEIFIKCWMHDLMKVIIKGILKCSKSGCCGSTDACLIFLQRVKCKNDETACGVSEEEEEEEEEEEGEQEEEGEEEREERGDVLETEPSTDQVEGTYAMELYVLNFQGVYGEEEEVAETCDNVLQYYNLDLQENTEPQQAT